MGSKKRGNWLERQSLTDVKHFIDETNLLEVSGMTFGKLLAFTSRNLRQFEQGNQPYVLYMLVN